jgi:uncharacterized protein RhaS with RHS repeats
MYDARVGRWLSEDPLGFAAGDTNVYRYVANDPTDATDPGGMYVGLLKALDKHRKELIAGTILALGRNDLEIALARLRGDRVREQDLLKDRQELIERYVRLKYGQDLQRREEIERLIRQLGDDDFETRVKARRKLEQLFKNNLDGYDLISKAVNDPDPEISRRARRIKEGLDRRIEEEELTKAP